MALRMGIRLDTNHRTKPEAKQGPGVLVVATPLMSERKRQVPYAIEMEICLNNTVANRNCLKKNVL